MTISRYLGLSFISTFTYLGCDDPTSNPGLENTIADECSEIGSEHVDWMIKIDSADNVY